MKVGKPFLAEMQRRRDAGKNVLFSAFALRLCGNRFRRNIGE